MARLTITVDDDVLRRARMRALRNDTSINSIIREHLEAYAGTESTRERVAESILRLSSRARSGRGSGHWSRDQLHKR